MLFKFETSSFIFGTKTRWEVSGLESSILRQDGKWVVLNALDEIFPLFFHEKSGTGKSGSGIQTLIYDQVLGSMDQGVYNKMNSKGADHSTGLYDFGRNYQTIKL